MTFQMSCSNIFVMLQFCCSCSNLFVCFLWKILEHDKQNWSTTKILEHDNIFFHHAPIFLYMLPGVGAFLVKITPKFGSMITDLGAWQRLCGYGSPSWSIRSQCQNTSLAYFRYNVKLNIWYIYFPNIVWLKVSGSRFNKFVCCVVLCSVLLCCVVFCCHCLCVCLCVCLSILFLSFIWSWSCSPWVLVLVLI